MVADIVNLSLATVNDKLIRKYKAYGQELYCVLYNKSTESCREKRRKMQLHLGENCRTCYRLW